jgi:hypothetical protein
MFWTWKYVWNKNKLNTLVISTKSEWRCSSEYSQVCRKKHKCIQMLHLLFTALNPNTKQFSDSIGNIGIKNGWSMNHINALHSYLPTQYICFMKERCNICRKFTSYYMHLKHKMKPKPVLEGQYLPNSVKEKHQVNNLEWYICQAAPPFTPGVWKQ